MKKKEVKQLYEALQSATNKGNAKLKYAVIKNSAQLEKEAKSFDTIKNGIESIVSEFNKEKASLIQEYGEINGNGQYYIKIDGSEKFKEFALKNSELELKHKESIDKYEKEIKSYLELLNEESDIDFKPFKIDFDKVPDDIEGFELSEMMKASIS